jgi:dihydrofolate reductase
MQAPGRPDEDTRGGFEHGGWAIPYQDEVMLKEMGTGFGTTDLLFGRRTYQGFFDFWPKQTDGNPFTEVLNAAQKYVVSRTLTEPLPWVNSALLYGDAPKAVDELKSQPGQDLVVLGSAELVRDLMRHGLVDSLTLLIHPLVLGTGRRLFAEGGPSAAWRLTSSVPTTTGVVIANYDVNESAGSCCDSRFMSSHPEGLISAPHPVAHMGCPVLPLEDSGAHQLDLRGRKSVEQPAPLAEDDGHHMQLDPVEDASGQRERSGCDAVHEHGLVARRLSGLSHRTRNIVHVGNERPAPELGGVIAGEDEDRYSAGPRPSRQQARTSPCQPQPRRWPVIRRRRGR